jgi:WD40 repeat protein
LTISVLPDGNEATLSVGSWDKNIYSFKLSRSGSLKASHVLTGHGDFVKALLSIPRSSLLISASADASMIIWDAGTQIKKLLSHTRGVQALALGSLDDSDSPRWRFYSGDSTGEIRGWSLSISNPSDIKEIPLPLNSTPEQIEPLRIHETSIFSLFTASSDDLEDLYSASADKTAKSVNPSGEVDLSLSHPDFVKCIVADHGSVFTGCRDGDVRAWSIADGKLTARLRGHFDEVTGLVNQATRVVSVSLDGTVRSWPKNGVEMISVSKKGDEMEDKGWNEEPAKKRVELTEEEEQELADLMDDD